ncbi:Golgi resident protein GCP60 [Galendromus occidentalis]|uniref:Golgi resident protein GCP60 n=1 Tax=Galendromus occidentalis TaxID=34638 RepID=A0AAJ6VV96_9ACAR|nr:Golgi resident protein GCP60 [Galendromus occidentalis]
MSLTSVGDSSDEDDEIFELPEIQPAFVSSHKNIDEFKHEILQGDNGMLKVCSGEILTVRIPTSDDGRFIYWEFATDDYDLAFGVNFEWNKCPDIEVTLDVNDTDTEEEDDFWADDEHLTDVNDIEAPKKDKQKEEPPTSVIVPVYRKNSHEEVIIGSHRYPGRGTYLLKFDNSYSFFRTKIVYYRCFYGQ